MLTDGTVTFADGTRRVFFTRPAGHGAGIFDITVDAGGMWTGRSLDGSTLEADQTGPTVDGFVRSATGEMLPFKHNDITRRLNYSRPGGQADRYTAIITRQSTEVVGRGGDVRQGRPSENMAAPASTSSGSTRSAEHQNFASTPASRARRRLFRA